LIDQQENVKLDAVREACDIHLTGLSYITTAFITPGTDRFDIVSTNIVPAGEHILAASFDYDGGGAGKGGERGRPYLDREM